MRKDTADPLTRFVDFKKQYQNLLASHKRLHEKLKADTARAKSHADSDRQEINRLEEDNFHLREMVKVLRARSDRPSTDRTASTTHDDDESLGVVLNSPGWVTVASIDVPDGYFWPGE